MKRWIGSGLFATYLQAIVYPIQFSIPESKIVQEIPKKTRDFAYLIAGQYDTYIYNTELDYYNGYREAYYAITCKRGGWDCLRHYEILANGCIPYFLDLDQCDSQTLAFFPRELIREAMHLEGVSYLHIDHSKFNLAKYYDILNRLISYTREHFTCRKMAEYILKTVHYGGGKILFLSQKPGADYLRCLTLIGFKELIGEKVIDVPKIDHIYNSFSDASHLYGKGMTYSRVLEDLPIDRDRIEERIRNKEFELVIYGSVHRGLPFYDIVYETYASEKIIHLCGEDSHACEWQLYLQSSPSCLFLREFH